MFLRSVLLFFYFFIAFVECQGIEDDVQTWIEFIEKLQLQTEGKIPPPFKPVETLAQQHLSEPCKVLDIGCETGKNSACLIRHGHQVVILDIAPNAIYYTLKNLEREGLDYGIQDCINIKIEELPLSYGPFKAVVGTYAFSFIPPDLFCETMITNVFSRIEKKGYFVGGFFGEKHAWASHADLSIVTVIELETFFINNGFTLLEINEIIQEIPTVSSGPTQFHTIHIIAQRN